MMTNLVLTVPEREASSAGARRTQDPAQGQAFEGEIEGIARRDRDSVPGEEPRQAAKGEETAEDAAPGGERTLIEVLSAFGAAAQSAGRADKAEGQVAGAEGDAAPAGEAESAAALQLAAKGKVDAETADDPKGRLRLTVARQETHFEPSPREGVLVEGEALAASPDSLGELKLVLDAKARRPGEARGAASPPAANAPGAQAATAEPMGLGGGRGLLALLDGRTQAKVAAIDPAGEGEPKEGSSADNGEPTLPGAQTSPRNPRERAAGVAALAQNLERASSRDADARPIAGAASAGLPDAATAPSVSAQIANRIVGAFADAPDVRRADGPASEAHLRFRAGGAVLKTLVIELQPEHLGTVSVSMRLKDGELAVEMAANRAETTRLLLEDRAALRSVLEKAGFTLDDTAITVTTRDTAPPAPAGAAGGREGGRDGGRGEGSFASPDRGGRDGRPADRERPPASGGAGGQDRQRRPGTFL